MTSLRLYRWVAVAFLLPVAVQVQGCRTSSPVETVSVSLRNTETYQYSTVGGDEEGARISIQANHYSISEIRRNAETNWVAVYVYRPAPGFIGSDQAEVDILSGSDGASSPTRIKRVVFRFVVRD